MSYQELSRSVVKARKVHFCTWCLQDILPGHHYTRIACIVDSDFCTTKLHPECDLAVARSAKEQGAGLFMYDEGDGERGKSFGEDSR